MTQMTQKRPWNLWFQLLILKEPRLSLAENQGTGFQAIFNLVNQAVDLVNPV
jgi:hypothetical protein